MAIKYQRIKINHIAVDFFISYKYTHTQTNKVNGRKYYRKNLFLCTASPHDDLILSF